MKVKKKQTFTLAEVDELTSLYNAWFAALLRKLGTGEYRISRKQFREGLGNIKCDLLVEGDEYVIRLSDSEDVSVSVSDKQEDTHGGEEK